MTVRLAIGVGCRRGAPADAVRTLVREAQVAAGGGDDATLFTVEGKRGEPGLHRAAADLGWPLAFLSRDALRAAMPGVVTPSSAAQARFGVASVSEAAALAGAGPGARLLVARLARDGVTCAVAGVP